VVIILYIITVDNLDIYFVNFRFHTYSSLLLLFSIVCIFGVKINGLSSLEVLLPF
jgi:hypothetical protein